MGQGASTDFPYDIGDEVASFRGKTAWTLYKGKAQVVRLATLCSDAVMQWYNIQPTDPLYYCHAWHAFMPSHRLMEHQYRSSNMINRKQIH
jgi:hypothetical protein